MDNEEIRSENKYGLKKFDTLMAWIAIAAGYFFVRLFPVRTNRLGALIFLITLFALTFFYVRRSGMRPTARSLVFLTFAAALAPAFIVTSDESVIGWLYFGELCVYMYFLSSAGRNDLSPVMNELFWIDAVRAAVVVPFKALDAHFCALFPRGNTDGEKPSNGSKIVKGILWGLLGLCAAVIPTVIVVSLLSFDKGFMELIDKITDLDLEWFGKRFFSLILGVPIAIFVYSAFISSRRGNLREGAGERAEKRIEAVRCLPPSLVYTALTPVLAVYVIFFVSQRGLYLSAFTGVLPEGFIYSEYAREGFFQLCVVAGLNAAALIAIACFVRQKSRSAKILLKIYMIVTSAMTILLIATAIAKMVMYIKAYGLTLKRIHASWFMVLLAAAFILVIIKQLWGKMKFTASLVALTALFCAVLAYSNAGGIVADYNVSAYLDGRLESVDYYEIARMGDAGIPALEKLKKEGSAQDAEKAGEFIDRYIEQNKDADNGIFTFNIPGYRAKKIINK